MGDEQQQSIGNYTILSRIGGGQQGWVYHARVAEHVSDELPVGRIVALKEMHPVFGAEDTVHQLESRTRALLKLHHPNLVGYLDLFVANPGSFSERHVLVMEHLEGTTLRDLMDESPGGLDWEVVQSIFTQCLEGLVYACDHGIIHRDIKPSNVFLCKGGVVKLIDFDLARKESGTQTAATGGVRGTFDYMAPDFAPDFEPSPTFRGDRMSDIFSLAVCLFQALTGRLPFGPGIESASDFFRRWRQDAKLKPSLRHGIFWVLVNSQPMMEKALSIDRDSRYREFAEFLADFQQIHARVVRHGDEEYHPMAVVGQGGFGMVFKARRKPDDTIIALKYLSSTEHVKRFVREARVLKQISHPHVVTFIDFLQIRNPEQYFLAMEYLSGMPGSSLSDRLRKCRRGLPDHKVVGLPPPEVAGLFDAYLSALVCLHEKGILHRDIKPSNLYAPVGAPERAKIMDLGIARDERGTQTVGRLPGTLEYMAPEFGRPDHGRGTTQTDIYSLGLCFYEALTGRPPFPRLPRSDREALAEFQKRCEDPPAIGYDAPVFKQYPLLREAAATMLAYEPADRFSSAAEARVTLQKALEQKELLESDAETVFLDEPETAYVGEGAADAGAPQSLAAEFRPKPIVQATPTSAAIENAESVPSAVKAFLRRLVKPMAAAALAVIIAGGSWLLYDRFSGTGDTVNILRAKTTVAMRDLGKKQYEPLLPYAARLAETLSDIKVGVETDVEYPMWLDWLQDAGSFSREIPVFFSNKYVRSEEDVAQKEQRVTEWLSLGQYAEDLGWSTNAVWDALRQFMQTDLAMQNYRDRLAAAGRGLPAKLAITNQAAFAAANAVAAVYLEYTDSEWPKTDSRTATLMTEALNRLESIVTNCIVQQVSPVAAGNDPDALNALSQSLSLLAESNQGLDRIFSLSALRDRVDAQYVSIDRSAAKENLLAAISRMATAAELSKAQDLLDRFRENFMLQDDSPDLAGARGDFQRRLADLAGASEREIAAAFEKLDVDGGREERDALKALLGSVRPDLQTEVRVDWPRLDAGERRATEYLANLGEETRRLRERLLVIGGKAQSDPVGAVDVLLGELAGLSADVRDLPTTTTAADEVWKNLADALLKQITQRDPLDRRGDRLSAAVACLGRSEVRAALAADRLRTLDEAVKTEMNIVWLTVRNVSPFDNLELESDVLPVTKLGPGEKQIAIDRSAVAATSLTFRVIGPAGHEPVPSRFDVALIPGGARLVTISDVRAKPVPVTLIGAQLDPPIKGEWWDESAGVWKEIRTDTRLSPGQYRVQLLRDDYQPQETELTIRAGTATVPVARPGEKSWQASEDLLALQRLVAHWNNGDYAELRKGMAGKELTLKHSLHTQEYEKLTAHWQEREAKIAAAVADLGKASGSLCDKPDMFLTTIEGVLKDSEYRSEPRVQVALTELAGSFIACATNGLSQLPLATRRERVSTWRQAIARQVLSLVLAPDDVSALRLRADVEWNRFVVVIDNDSEMAFSLTAGEGPAVNVRPRASQLVPVPATAQRLTLRAEPDKGYTPKQWETTAENGGFLQLRVDGFDVQPVQVAVDDRGLAAPPAVTRVRGSAKAGEFGEIPADGLLPGDYTVRFERADYKEIQIELKLKVGDPDKTIQVPLAAAWEPGPNLQILEAIREADRKGDNETMMALLEKPVTFLHPGHRDEHARASSKFIGSFQTLLKREIGQLEAGYSEWLGYSYQVSDPSVDPPTYRRNVEAELPKPTGSVSVPEALAPKMATESAALKTLIELIETGKAPPSEDQRRLAHRLYRGPSDIFPQNVVDGLFDYQAKGGSLNAYDVQLLLFATYRCWQQPLQWYRNTERKAEDPRSWERTLQNYVDRTTQLTRKLDTLLLSVDAGVAEKTVSLVAKQLKDPGAKLWLHGYLLRFGGQGSEILAAASKEWQGQAVTPAVKQDMDLIAELNKTGADTARR